MISCSYTPTTKHGPTKRSSHMRGPNSSKAFRDRSEQRFVHNFRSLQHLAHPLQNDRPPVWDRFLGPKWLIGCGHPLSPVIRLGLKK